MVRRMRELRLIVIAAMASALVAGCDKKEAPKQTAETSHAEAEKEAFGRLSVDEVDAKIADAKAGKLAFVVYDNNSKDRYAEGHVPSAKWVDFKNVTAADLPADKNTELVFYCSNEH